jgi:hypothetical protein
LGSVTLKYNILPGLDLTGRVKYDNTNDKGSSQTYASTIFLFAHGNNGSYNTSSANNKQTYAALLLSYNKTFKDFSISATAGGVYLDSKNSNAGMGGPLGLIPNFFAVSNIIAANLTYGETKQLQNQVQSVLGTVQLGYKQRLFLDVSARNDWASGLAFTNSASIFYPSVGLSAIVSDMVNLPAFVSYAKLRGSYAEVGNAPQPYLSNPLFSSSPGSVGTITSAPFTTLKPERTSSYEGGIDLKFARNHVSFSATYYNTNTLNQIFTVNVPPAVGVSNYYINAGKINNHGVQATLGYNGKMGAVDWRSDLTFSLNRNRIKQLLPAFEDPYTKEMRSQDTLNVSGGMLVTGGRTGDMYYTDFEKDAKGNVVVDDNGLPILARNASKVGNSDPSYNLGLNSGFSYKNFNLNFVITARVGGNVVSNTEAILDYYGASTKSAVVRDNGGIDVYDKLISAQDYFTRTQSALAQYTYSATNVRLREVSLGYTVPARVFNNKIKALRLSVIARNPWMIYCNAPHDPESVASTATFYQGYDYLKPPSLRCIGFSVKDDL